MASQADLRDDIDPEEFGEWLRECRIEDELTQEELAIQLDVTQPAVGSWERGEALPRQVNLDAIEERFGVYVAAEEDDDRVISEFGIWLRDKRSETKTSQSELATKANVSALAISFIETGRTLSPRPSTVDALKKALGEDKLSPQVEKDLEEKQEVTGGLGDYYGPFPIQGWKEHAEDVACLYVIYDGLQRPVRIGHTSSLPRRLREYEGNYWWFRAPTASSFAYVVVANEEIRKQVERIMIKFMGNHVIFNIQHRLQD